MISILLTTDWKTLDEKLIPPCNISDQLVSLIFTPKISRSGIHLLKTEFR